MAILSVKRILNCHWGGALEYASGNVDIVYFLKGFHVHNQTINYYIENLSIHYMYLSR